MNEGQSFKFLRGSQIGEKLRNFIDNSEKIQIAVAFLKTGGYN